MQYIYISLHRAPHPHPRSNVCWTYKFNVLRVPLYHPTTPKDPPSQNNFHYSFPGYVSKHKIVQGFNATKRFFVMGVDPSYGAIGNMVTWIWCSKFIDLSRRSMIHNQNLNLKNWLHAVQARTQPFAMKYLFSTWSGIYIYYLYIIIQKIHQQQKTYITHDYLNIYFYISCCIGWIWYK